MLVEVSALLVQPSWPPSVRLYCSALLAQPLAPPALLLSALLAQPPWSSSMGRHISSKAWCWLARLKQLHHRTIYLVAKYITLCSVRVWIHLQEKPTEKHAENSNHSALCGKGFISWNHIKKHMKCCSGDNLYHCAQCDIKVPTPDLCGECLILNYYSSLPQEHIHKLLSKPGKTHDEMQYSKFISSYCKNIT